MKKILFVTDERQMGGVSIVLEDILNNLDYQNKKVDLLILHNNGDRLTNIPTNVNILYGTNFFDIIDIPLKRIIEQKKYLSIIKKIYLSFLMKTNFIKHKIKKERKKILNKKYDIEIAFKHGFTTLFVYYGDATKKINWVHCDCKLNDPAINYRKTFKKIVSNFDNNITLSKITAQNFKEIYNCENIKIINNLISENKIKQKTKDIIYQKEKSIYFITVGRLSVEKGYLKLIEVFNRLNKENLIGDVYLNMIGDGELKNVIQNKINEYSLENHIKLLGKMNNPYNYLKKADMFILSSDNEGYPLVLIESFMCGTPVISTSIASAEEMIDKDYGIIVDNSTDGLYEGIKNLIINRDTIDILRKNLKNYKYRNEQILKEIEELFK